MEKKKNHLNIDKMFMWHSPGLAFQSLRSPVHHIPLESTLEIQTELATQAFN